MGEIKNEQIGLETIISHIKHFKKVLNDSVKCLTRFEFHPTGKKTIKTERTDNNKKYWFLIDYNESPLEKKFD